MLNNLILQKQHYFLRIFKKNSNLFNYKKSLMLTNVTKLKIELMKRVYENIKKM